MKTPIDRATLSKEELRLLRYTERIERRARTKLAIARDKLEIERLRARNATLEQSKLATKAVKSD